MLKRPLPSPPSASSADRASRTGLPIRGGLDATGIEHAPSVSIIFKRQSAESTGMNAVEL